MKEKYFYNSVVKDRLYGGWKKLKDFFVEQNRLITAVILLVILALVLSMPTIKPLRSVEAKPEKDGLFFWPDEPLVNDVQVPAGKLSYFVAWIQDSQGAPKAPDYEKVTLEVKAADGKVIRTAARPQLVKKEDIAALLFEFDTIKTNGHDHLIFTLRQAGGGHILVRRPVEDQVKPGEAAAIPFQLGEKKNWLTLLIDKVYAENLDQKDIASYVHRGRQIVRGENPYACVLDKNDPCIGYPAHLPGMYLFAAGLVAMGFNDIPSWTIVWRPIVIAAWLGIGIILFIYIYRRKQPALAVVALGFWLFNRWSIDVLRIAHTDFLGVFFLLLSVMFARRWPKAAAIMLGISLAIKQVAILAVPIFLLYMWRHKKLRAMSLIILIGLIVVIPLLTTLPFLIDNFKATTQGLLFVAERPSQVVHGFAPSLDTWLDVTGAVKSLLMLFFVGAIYVAVWRKSVDLIGGVLMLMAVMMAFTSVLYNQYLVWFIPFIPLATVKKWKAQRQK